MDPVRMLVSHDKPCPQIIGYTVHLKLLTLVMKCTRGFKATDNNMLPMKSACRDDIYLNVYIEYIAYL